MSRFDRSGDKGDGSGSITITTISDLDGIMDHWDSLNKKKMESNSVGELKGFHKEVNRIED